LNKQFYIKIIDSKGRKGSKIVKSCHFSCILWRFIVIKILRLEFASLSS